MTAEHDSPTLASNDTQDRITTIEANATTLVLVVRNLLARLRETTTPLLSADPPRGDSFDTPDAAFVSTAWRDYIHSDETDEIAPFLSIVLVVGAASRDQVSDALVALDAQNDTNFELLLVVPASEEGATTIPGAGRAQLEDQLLHFSSSLAPRSRVVESPAGAEDRAARDAALSVGITAARGRYITFLDATSVVFGHFVATFAEMSAVSPTAVLRARAITQPLREMTWPDGRRGYEPTGGARPASAAHFGALEHLLHSTSPDFLGSPPGSFALRRRDVEILRLHAGEDELLVEAAVLGGVTNNSEDVVVLLHHFNPS
jgi:hypothetical protein